MLLYLQIKMMDSIRWGLWLVKQGEKIIWTKKTVKKKKKVVLQTLCTLCTSLREINKYILDTW